MGLPLVAKNPYSSRNDLPFVRQPRRVLVITFDYLPMQVVGTLRPAGLAKYLGEFGWYPIVLTRSVDGRCPGQANIIETGYRDLKTEIKTRLHLDGRRSLHEQLGLPIAAKPKVLPLHSRLIHFVEKILIYPDPAKGWIPFTASAIADLARAQQVDAVISTAPPFTAHMVGAKAKQLLGCPWIADYRDLWNTDRQTCSRDATGLLAMLRRRTERNVVNTADVLVTVSEAWADRLRQRFPSHNALCISNGFDEDDFAGGTCELTRTFTISHTGQLYEGRRDPSLLFETIYELLAEGKLLREHVRLRFYGPIEPFLPRLVTKFELGGIVELHGIVPRTQAIKIQRESQLLLLLAWSHPAETGCYTAKIYEYLASRRPVLAIGGGRGCVKQLLDETGAGVHVISKPELRKVLIEAYWEFRKHGSVRYCGSPAMIAKYSHREMAHNYARLLDSLACRRSNSSQGSTPLLRS
jgi:hypothetical protein